MEKLYNKFFKNALSIALTVVICVLAIISIVAATTTIGTNIDTDGTLVVDGNATTSGNLVVGTTSWAAPTSTLTLDGTAYITGKATTSHALWVGTGGSPANTNFDVGDLYVQGGAEFDGPMFLGDATGDTITIAGHIVDATITAELIVGPTSWAAPTSTLTVDGSGYFTGSLIASGKATTSNNLVVGAGLKTWAVPTSTLTVDGGGYFTGNLIASGKATTSIGLWVGAAGTTNNVDMAGGDLFVQGDVEIDGVTYMDRATSTSATTTNYLYVGVDGTEDNFNFAGGDLYVQGAAELDGGLWASSATTTGSLAVGANASTTGDVWVSGGTLDMTTTTATTTMGLFVRSHSTGTSTVSIGSDIGDKTIGCIEMLTSAGTYVRAIIDGTDWNIKAGRCN